jgi:hypothetical protein
VWCRQCQYFTGGGPAHNAMFNTADVKIEGELGSHAYVAESGTTIVRWFCPDCATPVYVQATTRPHFRTVRLGVIDQPHDLAPRMAIWADRNFKRPCLPGLCLGRLVRGMGPYVGTGLAATVLNPARATAGNPPGRPPCPSISGASRLLSPKTAFAWHRP